MKAPEIALGRDEEIRREERARCVREARRLAEDLMERARKETRPGSRRAAMFASGAGALVELARRLEAE